MVHMKKKTFKKIENNKISFTYFPIVSAPDLNCV